MTSLVSLLSSIFLAVLPLNDASQWEVVRFDGVAPNRVTFGSGELRISVDSSASPLLHVFSEPKRFSSLFVSGRIEGELELEDSSAWPDDAFLRVGVVVAKDKPPSSLLLLTAPDWVKRIHDRVAGSGRGVESIRTYHVVPRPDLLGQSRENPASDIFLETIAAIPGEDGRFSIDASFDPAEMIGVWVLADGDDTGSTFEVSIDRIEAR